MRGYTNFMTYDNVLETAITVAGDTYEEVARLTTPVRPQGKYQVTQSMIFNLNSITSAAYFRFSKDGGTVWSEVRLEPKDIADQIVKNYTFVQDHLGGVFELIVQARKETAGDILTIHRMDVILDRKI